MASLRSYLRNFNIIKISYRKFYESRNLCKDFLFEVYYKTQNTKIIYSYFARINNFGDLFNYDLINYFGYKLIYKNSVDKSKVALLGSILQMYSREYNGYVLGSGFIDERFSRSGNKWRIRLIRGPLSLAQCSTLGSNNVVFGDPGILASLMYKLECKKKYKLGIIPHVSDYDAVKHNFGDKIKVIRAKDHPRKVARDIQECDFIASSSLHGLIFADSFRIPNVHLKFGDKLLGGHHKFRDYYQGMGVVEYHFLNYNSNLQEEFIISECFLRYSDEVLLSKQKEILNIYNVTLNEIFEGDF